MAGWWRGGAVAATWLLAGCFSGGGSALQLEIEGGAGGVEGCAAAGDCADSAGAGGSARTAGGGGDAGGMPSAGGAGGIAGAGEFAGGFGSAGAGMAGLAGFTGTGGVAGMAGSAAFAAIGGGGTGGDTGGTGGGMMRPPPPPPDPLEGCNSPGAYDPLRPAAGESCYDLPIHGVSGPTDDTPLPVQAGEAYHGFYYDVPWAEGSVATRLGADLDNIQVIYAWWLFSSMRNVAGGTVETNILSTVLGENAELLGSWQVGGCNLTFPTDVGLALPKSGKLLLHLHIYNVTGAPQTDASRIQICTLPAGSRPHVASLTFLGTEDLNGLDGMPPGESAFSGSCQNVTDGPIRIVTFVPRMHFLGLEMQSSLRHADGSTEVVFQQPFQFDYQIHYPLDPPVVMAPADVIDTTCHFFNDTGRNVPYGSSAHMETCYQLAYSSPAGTLENGVVSLVGADNTCW